MKTTKTTTTSSRFPTATTRHILLALCGLCPFCEQPVRRYAYDDPLVFDHYEAGKPVFKCRLCAATVDDPTDAGEKHAESCRWRNVDPHTGHRRDCPHPEEVLL